MPTASTQEPSADPPVPEEQSPPHDTTTAAGSTSAQDTESHDEDPAPTSSSSPEELKEELRVLQERRTAAETDIRNALDFLATTPVGLHGALVDAEGFPRSDCDLYAVRENRHTVICRRNDLQAIEEEMFEKLNALHSCTKDVAKEQMARYEEERRRGREEAEKRQARMMEVQRMARLTPFLTVASVEVGSPASDGGLRRGQLVLRFGDLDAESLPARGVQAMGTITKEHEGRLLSVWVKEVATTNTPSGAEEVEVKELFVVPQRWAGVGLLGSAFDPIHEE